MLNERANVLTAKWGQEHWQALCRIDLREWAPVVKRPIWLLGAGNATAFAVALRQLGLMKLSPEIFSASFSIAALITRRAIVSKLRGRRKKTLVVVLQVSLLELAAIAPARLHTRSGRAVKATKKVLGPK